MKKIITCFLPLILVFSLMSVSGCNRDPKPDNLIPEKKYIHVTAEFELLKAYQSQYKDSSKTVQLKDTILKHYGVSFNQFMQSRNYYMKIKKQHDLMKKALDALNEERNRIWEGNSKKDSSKSVLHTKPKKLVKADTQSSRKR